MLEPVGLRFVFLIVAAVLFLVSAYPPTPSSVLRGIGLAFLALAFAVR